MNKCKKRGQLWSIDLVIAVIIFLMGLFFFYKFAFTTQTTQADTLNDLTLHAEIVSSFIMSPGDPADWTNETVNSLGITDGNFRLQQDKVQRFFNMMPDEYNRTRRLLSTSKHYQIRFVDNVGMPVVVGNVSSIGLNSTQINPESIVALTRFGFYNSQIVQVMVEVWS
jgi:hypothetical protein